MSITLIDARNPQWVAIKRDQLDSDGNPVKDSEGKNVEENVLDSNGDPLKCIECEAKWSHMGDSSQEWQKFLASPEDTAEHGRLLFEDLKAGKYGTVAAEA
tara:strand:+ start:357 stop:659 length:303 start_codon:yes stop_codon:yes gene_type:complete